MCSIVMMTLIFRWMKVRVPHLLSISDLDFVRIRYESKIVCHRLTYVSSAFTRMLSAVKIMIRNGMCEHTEKGKIIEEICYVIKFLGTIINFIKTLKHFHVMRPVWHTTEKFIEWIIEHRICLQRNMIYCLNDSSTIS